MLTFSALAMAPNGNLYAASQLTGRIAEYDLDGNLVRLLLVPADATLPIATGNPQSLAVGADGTIYYADLDLRGTLPDVGPGPNGKVWRIRFDAAGDPLPPEIVREGLAFPDGVALFPGDLEVEEPPGLPLEWPTLAGGPRRQFSNPDETTLTAGDAGRLIERWRFRTEAVVTSSPTVATVDRPGSGAARTVFFTSWDGHLYAVDWATGAEQWRFEWEDQPGASFPAAGSPTVTDVDGERVVLFGAGEHLRAGRRHRRRAVALRRRHRLPRRHDRPAARPLPLHRRAEPGRVDADRGRRRRLLRDGHQRRPDRQGRLLRRGHGPGTLAWFFDVESGAVCRPAPDDDVRRYDGYHSEAELGPARRLPHHRDGCDHPRNRNGCGNVWSSPAFDPARGLLVFGTSNCDTDADPGTPVPDDADAPLRRGGRRPLHRRHPAVAVAAP